MELLAPAGSYEALIAAVQSGADAVYVGGSRFSARGSAQNFENDDLVKWIKYCHVRGVNVHVAANTLIKEREADDFLEYIGFLNSIGVDAVIMQDIGMAYAVKKLYPELEIHASTQLTCASVRSAKALEESGFSRIVLARELDEKSIEKIKKSVNCEIEVFVHGAICMSYSGQCLMSSIIGGRSGNRGYCAQPCRLPYKFVNNGKNISEGYLLSPKDMCLAEHLEKLGKIGVDSLKIEGRLKRSEYVSTIVGVYRKLLDENRKPTENEIKELLDAFNRSGFTDGYFTHQTGKAMMAYNTPSNISDNKFAKEAIARCSEGIEIKKIPVTISAEIKIGQPIAVTVSDGKNKAVARGVSEAEYALNVPLSCERVTGQLNKLGQTPFVAKETFVDMDDNVTLPISEINNTRRKAVEELIKNRETVKRRKAVDVSFDIQNIAVNVKTFTASVRTAEQARACIDFGIKRIYAPSAIINSVNSENVEFIEALSPIDREGRTVYGTKSKIRLANSIGQISDTKDSCLNSRMNITNSYALKMFENSDCVTLSTELTLNEIAEIKKPCDTEIIVYGRIPLMTFENCPVKAHGKCSKGKDKSILIDRMKEEFPLLCGEGCFCELINSKPVYMADKMDDLKKTGVKYLRLDFTVEGYDECTEIIRQYSEALAGDIIPQRKENTFTRGHFYKPVR